MPAGRPAKAAVQKAMAQKAMSQKDKGTKRPAPANEPAAKRQAADPPAAAGIKRHGKSEAAKKRNCETVSAVILTARDLDPTVREMLHTALPCCFPEGSDPHPHQHRVLAMVREVLGRVLAGLERQETVAEKACGEAKDQHRLDEEEKARAEQALSTATQEEESQKSRVKTSGLSVTEAQAACETVSSALRRCDEEIGETAMEREVLARKLKDSPDPDLAPRLEELSALLTSRALARVPTSEDLVAARQKIADAEAHRQVCKDAHAAAREVLRERQGASQDATEAVQKAVKAKSKALGQVAYAQRKLADLKSGAGAAFCELTGDENIPAVPQAAQQPEGAGMLAPQETALEKRSSETLKHKLRRHSFMPRHLVMRRAATAGSASRENATAMSEDAPQTVTLPTEPAAPVEAESLSLVAEVLASASQEQAAAEAVAQDQEMSEPAPVEAESVSPVAEVLASASQEQVAAEAVAQDQEMSEPVVAEVDGALKEAEVPVLDTTQREACRQKRCSMVPSELYIASEEVPADTEMTPAVAELAEVVEAVAEDSDTGENVGSCTKIGQRDDKVTSGVLGGM